VVCETNGAINLIVNQNCYVETDDAIKILIPSVDANVAQTDEHRENLAHKQIDRNTNKHVDTQSNVSIKEAMKQLHSRPWTDDQRKTEEEKNDRTAYISGEGNDLVKLFKHKPRQLNKELAAHIGSQTDKVYLTPQGGLRVIVQNQTQRNKY